MCVCVCVCVCVILLTFPDVFLLYAKLEEEHGLARHAMAVYDRATKAVPADQQLEVSDEYHWDAQLASFQPSKVQTAPLRLLMRQLMDMYNFKMASGGAVACFSKLLCTI